MLQGSAVPPLFQKGLLYGDLLGFIVMAAGQPITSDFCKDRDPTAMQECLQAVHACGVVHGDISLSNFVRSPSNANAMWLVDFSQSCTVTTQEKWTFRDDLSRLEYAINRATMSLTPSAASSS